MSDTANILGTYLRARRELVTPEQVGIPVVGVRRVPGLRREEVATLAGISADYYLRLERGRDRHPSAQVLRAIARVLQLDDDHLAHLLSLGAEVTRRSARAATAPAGALALMNSLTQPAFIEDRFFDIVASNALARALSPGLTPGGNQLRDFFLDPAEQALHPEWEDFAECLVANLRQAAGTDVTDRRFVELTGELAAGSAEFRRLWARHEVRGQRGTRMRIVHPEVGEMALNRERLSIDGADGLMLVVYHPTVGSTDADRLALLASVSLPVAAGRATGARTAGD